jgi:hypothetical protein
VQLVFLSYSANFEYFHYVMAGSSNVFGIEPDEFMCNPNGWRELAVPKPQRFPVRGQGSGAHDRRSKVVAEGVEQTAQRQILRQANCDYVQGYLLSQPQMPEGLMK